MLSAAEASLRVNPVIPAQAGIQRPRRSDQDFKPAPILESWSGIYE